MARLRSQRVRTFGNGGHLSCEKIRGAAMKMGGLALNIFRQRLVVSENNCKPRNDCGREGLDVD